MKKVSVISGDHFTDARGTVSFVNAFRFPDIKRFYTIHHPDTDIIRAWQGHKIESKYFYVTQGSFLIAYVLIDSWDNPSESLLAQTIVLDAEQPAILCIPPGYANGIKALAANATLLSFSDLDIDAAKTDNWRFDQNLWLDWSKY